MVKIYQIDRANKEKWIRLKNVEWKEVEKI
jgi:hypothetical protein